MSDPDAVDAKIVLLGAASVGKTCVIARGVSQEFDADMPNTVGASFTGKQVVIDGGVVNLQIWDTAGQERFRTIAPMYYRGAVAALLVFSITDEQSFVAVQSWADELRSQVGGQLPIIFLVGNKLDLADERRISVGDGEELARKLDARYHEVSAKDGRGVPDLFSRVAEEAFARVGSSAGAAGGGGVAIAGAGGRKKKRRPIC
jgi:small GTP-binding protein